MPPLYDYFVLKIIFTYVKLVGIAVKFRNCSLSQLPASWTSFVLKKIKGLILWIEYMKSQTLAVTDKVTFPAIPVKTAIILHIKES